MQEQDFRKLLDKYLDGSISENEKKLLNKFEEKLTTAANFIIMQFQTMSLLWNWKMVVQKFLKNMVMSF